MIVIFYESSVSYRTVAEHVSNVFREHGFETHVTDSYFDVSRLGTVRNMVIIGSLTALFTPVTKYGRNIIFYIDVPIVPLFTSLFRRKMFELGNRSIFVTNSRHCATIVEKWIGYNVHDVVHHGTDMCYIGDSVDRPRHFVQVALFAGRKNIPMYIKLAHVLNTYTFTLVTNRRFWRHVTSIPRNLHVVDSGGYMPRHEICNIYVQHRVYVCTSIHEGFCLPVLESACCGCVPVVPDVPPYIEYVPWWAGRYRSWIDYDRLVEVGIGEYVPHVEHDFDDMVRKCIYAQFQSVAPEEVEQYFKKMCYRNVYKKFVEYIR